MCTNIITFFKITFLIQCQRDDIDADVQNILLFFLQHVQSDCHVRKVVQLRGGIHIVVDSVRLTLD